MSGGTLLINGSGVINPTTGGALTLGVQNIGSGTFQYDSSGTSKFGVMSIGTAGTLGGGTLNQTNGVVNGTSMTLGGR